MGSVYSTRFIATAASGASSYVVPSGNVAVVRSVTACNLDSAVQWFTVSIQPAAVNMLAVYLQPISAAPYPDTHTYDLHVVVASGETIEVSRALATTHVTVSGYLLTTV